MPHLTTRVAGLAGAGLLALAACASPQDAGPSDEIVRPSPDSAYTDDLARSLNNAGFEIFKAAASDNANTAVSPLSIGVAFGMLDAGASSPVKEVIQDFFAFPASGAERLAAFNALEQKASHSPDDAEEPANKDAPAHATVTVANRLFLDDGFEPLDTYKENLARYFGAGAEVTPMSSDPETAARVINGWVKDKTEGLIPQLVSPDAFDDQSRVTLVNALYMKAEWAVPFDPANTWEDAFTRADGSQVTVDMMHAGMADGPVYQGDDAVAVVLAYAYDELEMTLIVPQDGAFEKVRDGLDQQQLDTMAAASAPTLYTLALPRFEVDSQTNLRSVMEGDLGAENLYDVVGLDGIGRDLYVSGAVHAAKVIVDEQGTEAAAATGIVAGATSAPAEPPLEIRADRPFLYVITDTSTGAVLFVGQVLDPS